MPGKLTTVYSTNENQTLREVFMRYDTQFHKEDDSAEIESWADILNNRQGQMKSDLADALGYYDDLDEDLIDELECFENSNADLIDEFEYS